jgi:Leucine-rich repeat (LRR) protein
MMSPRFLPVLLLLFSAVANGQVAPPPGPVFGPSIPVFASRADSISYAELDRKLETLSNLAITERNDKKLDSVQRVRRAFLDAHSHVLRTLYRQDRFYTPYQSLRSIKNLDSITKISVVGNGRTSLPDSLYLYKNLAELELIGFRVSRLPKRLVKQPQFKKLTLLNNFPEKRLKLPRSKSVTALIIRGDEKDRIPKSYKKFRNLQLLNLSRNNMTQLPATHGCRKLQSLVLIGNSITLGKAPPRQTTTIRHLDLSINKITVVPSWINMYTNLKGINFNNNRVERVEPGIEKLKGLEELSLYKNKLSAVPPMFYTMTSLRVIDLYYNHIAKVETSIANWEKMEILYLANNELYSIPDEIGNLKKLKELYLHHNKLSVLPETIGDLKDLGVLRINNNRLIEWPERIFELKSLINFDCSFNQFETLPMERFSFHDLKILAVGGNPWDNETKERISIWAETLRENNTVVHLK